MKRYFFPNVKCKYGVSILSIKKALELPLLFTASDVFVPTVTMFSTNFVCSIRLCIEYGFKLLSDNMIFSVLRMGVTILEDRKVPFISKLYSGVFV